MHKMLKEKYDSKSPESSDKIDTSADETQVSSNSLGCATNAGSLNTDRAEILADEFDMLFGVGEEATADIKATTDIKATMSV